MSSPVPESRAAGAAAAVRRGRTPSSLRELLSESGRFVTAATLASNISSCSFDYSGADLQRNALLRMTLQITDQGESVSLYHEVHVNNTP